MGADSYDAKGNTYYTVPALAVIELTVGGVYKDGIQEHYAYSHGIAAAEYNDAIYYCPYIFVDGVKYYGERAKAYYVN